MSRGKCGITCLERRCLRFVYAALFSPTQRKPLNDFCFLEAVAESVFSEQVEFPDTSIIITEPYFNFSSIQESMNEILFEEYQFQSALRINGESQVEAGRYNRLLK